MRKPGETTGTKRGSVRPPVLVRISDRATVYEVGDAFYLRLDAAGRWAMVGEGGAVFRRSVDGGVVRSTGKGTLRLAPAEEEAVHAWVARRAAALRLVLARAAEDDVAWLGERRVALERLAAATCWTPAAWSRVRARYQAAYPESPPILPPHRYRDLVLLPATGCPNHRCRFCAFYRDRPFRVLDGPAFEEHLAAVRTLFGPALAERDGIFLGSASALTLDDRTLVARLRRMEEVFGAPRRGIASFLDPDRGRLRSEAAWRVLAEEGLTDATLGLETALVDLREEIGKSGDLDRFARVVESARRGGLSLALTVLLGLGGRERARAHREATVAYLGGLPLGAGDRIYLSPLEGGLPEAILAAERARWRAALATRTPARVGDYRIERFAWFS